MTALDLLLTVLGLEIIYFIVMNVTKIAFCFFLIRIFPQRWFRITVHTIIFLTIVATTVMTFRTVRTPPKVYQ